VVRGGLGGGGGGGGGAWRLLKCGLDIWRNTTRAKKHNMEDKMCVTHMYFSSARCACSVTKRHVYPLFLARKSIFAPLVPSRRGMTWSRPRQTVLHVAAECVTSAGGHVAWN
jgi:hypothetical protein